MPIGSLSYPRRSHRSVIHRYFFDCMDERFRDQNELLGHFEGVARQYWFHQIQVSPTLQFSVVFIAFSDIFFRQDASTPSPTDCRLLDFIYSRESQFWHDCYRNRNQPMSNISWWSINASFELDWVRRLVVKLYLVATIPNIPTNVDQTILKSGSS